MAHPQWSKVHSAVKDICSAWYIGEKVKGDRQINVFPLTFFYDL